MTAPATEPLTLDEVVKIAREQVDAFNAGNWEQLRAGLASDCRYDELGTQRKIDGPEKIVELFKGWKTAFPDAAGTVTNAVASGDTAALEVTWTGSHTGPLETAGGTIPASGRRQETPAALFFTFEGDKVKESRHYFDSPTLLKQIDAAQATAIENEGGRPPRRSSSASGLAHRILARLSSSAKKPSAKSESAK